MEIYDLSLDRFSPLSLALPPMPSVYVEARVGAGLSSINMREESDPKKKQKEEGEVEKEHIVNLRHTLDGASKKNEIKLFLLLLYAANGRKKVDELKHNKTRNGRERENASETQHISFRIKLNIFNYLRKKRYCTHIARVIILSYRV